MKNWLSNLLFERSRLVLWGLALVTLFLVFQASRLAIDAGFESSCPSITAGWMSSANTNHSLAEPTVC